MSRYFQLPDLPDAGYSSRRQKETTDAIMFFLRGVERNRPLLLDLVLGGRAKWRRVAGRVWRGLLIDGDLLNTIYGYMALLALASDKRIAYTDPERLIYTMGRQGLTKRLVGVLEEQRALLAQIAKQTAADRVWGTTTQH